MICERWEVVAIPFPFSEREASKRRPAVVLSTEMFNRQGMTIFAMVTSARHEEWTGDTILADLAPAGLHASSKVRLKLFTLDNRLVLKRLGRLSERDSASVRRQVQAALGEPEFRAAPSEPV